MSDKGPVLRALCLTHQAMLSEFAVQDLQGSGRGVASGMSIEGLMADTPPAGATVPMSRNTSGLDTMQSIEQALPDADGATGAAAGGHAGGERAQGGV